MEYQLLAHRLSPSNKMIDANSAVNRHLADFHPTVWGDHFINYAFEASNSQLISWTEEVEVLKEEVRKLITTCSSKPQLLNLVDTIQRLGIAYHFKGEIEQTLQTIFSTGKQRCNIDDDLHMVALEFRLLRQQGLYVSCDIFNKFKNDEGGFKEDLIGYLQGLLSLYEASYLSVHGEDILDEAFRFTAARLESVAAHETSPMADQIRHSLKEPIRRNINRQEELFYISMYQLDEGHVKSILKLAKLDFNIAQRMHQEELRSITMWWKELNFASELPFVRDRIVECYFWPLGVFFEPQFGMGRKMLTKAIAIDSVIDDTYDAYGTLQELELFTQVIQSFDISMKNKLPKYMQVSYQALLDLYDEFEEEMLKEGRAECKFFVKELTKKLVRAYLVEARWFNENYIPTMEEYMHNGYTTSVYPLFTAISFLGMKESASKEAFQWLLTEPKILKASSFIGRLINDFVSHKFEQSRGHVASAVECYIKQHGVSEEQAYYELNKLVENAWKDINEETLKSNAAANAIAMPLQTCILNFARVIYVVYKNEDCYTHSKTTMKNILENLLLKPLAI